MKAELSPLGHQVGEVYIPPRSGENGDRVGFVWEGNVYRLATHQEVLAALQAEAEKHPLGEHLSRREVRRLKVISGVRYLGQPRAKYR